LQAAHIWVHLIHMLHVLWLVQPGLGHISIQTCNKSAVLYAQMASRIVRLSKVASPCPPFLVHSKCCSSRMRPNSKSLRPCRIHHLHSHRQSPLSCRQIGCHIAQHDLQPYTDQTEGDHTPVARTGFARSGDAGNFVAATAANGWKGCRNTSRTAGSSWWLLDVECGQDVFKAANPDGAVNSQVGVAMRYVWRLQWIR